MCEREESARARDEMSKRVGMRSEEPYAEGEREAAKARKTTALDLPIAQVVDERHEGNFQALDFAVEESAHASQLSSSSLCTVLLPAVEGVVVGGELEEDALNEELGPSCNTTHRNRLTSSVPGRTSWE